MFLPKYTITNIDTCQDLFIKKDAARKTKTLPVKSGAGSVEFKKSGDNAACAENQKAERKEREIYR